MTNPLDTLMAPFQDLDIASTYQSHHLAFDFAIYLTLFTGLSQFVFSKKFPGKGGKAISIGIALALSMGMTLFSAATGFSLARFGPVAAGILMVLLGLLFYSLIKQLGGNTVNAGLASFILTYFLMRAVSPELYQWMQANPYASWIDAALLLSIPLLLVLLVMRVKGSLLPNLKLPALNMQKNGPAQTDTDKTAASLTQQEAASAEAIQADIKADKFEKLAAKDLDAIIALLAKKDLSPETINQVQAILQDLQRQESSFERTLVQIRIINDKLEKWEISSFEKLNQDFQQMSPSAQEGFKKTIQQEHQAILKHKTTEELQRRASQERRNYRQFLSRAINELGHNNKRGAIYFLQQAKQQEQFSKTDRAKANDLLKQLLSLTHKTAKQVKKLAA
jgi:hypothetical protein